MESTRNVHQSQEEVERYTNALGTLLIMQDIYHEVRKEKVIKRHKLYIMEDNARDRWERNARQRFIERCAKADINAWPYINGVTIRRAINVIASEIRSFKYALEQINDNDET